MIKSIKKNHHSKRDHTEFCFVGARGIQTRFLLNTLKPIALNEKCTYRGFAIRPPLWP